MRTYIAALRAQGIFVEKICSNAGVKMPIVFLGIKDVPMPEVFDLEEYENKRSCGNRGVVPADQMVRGKRPLNRNSISDESFVPVRRVPVCDPFSIECPKLARTRDILRQIKQENEAKERCKVSIIIKQPPTLPSPAQACSSSASLSKSFEN